MRPGKKFVFGRTKYDDIGDVIVLSHKTISRKHLAIELSQPSLDDCCNPQIRSKITIQDFDTKIGTLLNGKQIRGQTVELKKDKNYILLGRYDKSYFVSINWIPVVLTFSFSTKEDKAKPYANLYKIFCPLDIKVLEKYELDYTTHVVAKKRNTAKGLQALIDGKLIVHNDTFINALIDATTRKDGKKSPLEVDFEGNFPDPIQYLPPKGDEPTQRNEIAYTPNELRKNIFNDYIFVFYEERQYQNLLFPITAGCGEAILKIVDPNQTTAAEFVKFVNNLIIEKNLGGLGDKGIGKKVVVVRYNPSKGSDLQWYIDFGKEVSIQLNHRLFEQNEFLDAILANDVSSLCCQLQNEGLKSIELSVKPPTLRTPASPSGLLNHTSTKEPVPEPEPAPYRGRVRRTARPKFTGFDDDFSGPLLEPSSSFVEPNSISAITTIPEASASQSQGLFVSQDINHVSEIRTRDLIGQKRKAIPNFDEINDIEYTAIAAILSPESKRRRLDIEVVPRQIEVPESKPIETPNATDIPEKKKDIVSKLLRRVPNKKPDEIDAEVEEMFQRKLELDKAASESLAKAEHDAVCVELDSLEIAEIRNKIQVEEVQVKTPKRVERKRVEDGDRWNNSWNGRKNFKKFRRFGAAKRVSEKVIVQLEEVKKRDYGLFDNFLGESNRQRALNDTTDPSLAESRHQSPERSTVISISTLSPSLTSASLSRPLNNISRRNQSISSNQRSIATISLKRSAPHTLSGDRDDGNDDKILMVKKPRLMSINTARDESDDCDSDSDDGLKFRFKKK
ncbi:putative dna damage response protein [Erysiphe neolycopersici]|uniref:Putative dna damage response protein n=1 Tax=Erysiphe neolycopersici TaxID=212602 RepID=A0A420HFJ9_9PEZI|nr:putative dna damage response protein [Erysiphe neolycopersici]